jgi:hypothetical protein
MLNPFAVPDSWNDLFLSDKPMVRTSAFWTCALAMAYAVIFSTGFAIRLWAVRSVIPDVALAVPVLVFLDVVLIYLGWRFLAFVEDIRETVRQVPKEQSVALLRSGRAVTRIFYSLMFGVGIALALASMLLVLPGAR